MSGERDQDHNIQEFQVIWSEMKVNIHRVGNCAVGPQKEEWNNREEVLEMCIDPQFVFHILFCCFFRFDGAWDLFPIHQVIIQNTRSTDVIYVIKRWIAGSVL